MATQMTRQPKDTIDDNQDGNQDDNQDDNPDYKTT
jgi:hypothetical protein